MYNKLISSSILCALIGASNMAFGMQQNELLIACNYKKNGHDNWRILNETEDVTAAFDLGQNPIVAQETVRYDITKNKFAANEQSTIQFDTISLPESLSQLLKTDLPQERFSLKDPNNKSDAYIFVDNQWFSIAQCKLQSPVGSQHNSPIHSTQTSPRKNNNSNINGNDTDEDSDSQSKKTTQSQQNSIDLSKLSETEQKQLALMMFLQQQQNNSGNNTNHQDSLDKSLEQKDTDINDKYTVKFSEVDTDVIVDSKKGEIQQNNNAQESNNNNINSNTGPNTQNSSVNPNDSTNNNNDPNDTKNAKISSGYTGIQKLIGVALGAGITIGAIVAAFRYYPHIMWKILSYPPFGYKQ